MPQHLVEVIRERIALLRDAWHLDLPPSQPRLKGYPTFPSRQPDRARRLS
jgi:hypothetical protein